MKENTMEDILKEAILLEKRGKIFYETVAKQTKNNGIKDIFLMMAREENDHISILIEQYELIKNNKTFKWDKEQELKYSEKSSVVLDKNFIDQINAADYEAAAIYAAIAMEKNAITLYSNRAEQAEDKDEKALYEWLTRWENSHLVFLAQIDKELCEEIWYQNKFWAF